ncbi:hypothetical protein OUO20_06020 [Arthrobacter sp. FX8]|uniref:hypothetical protein n=1 Tax=Arthrobacter sp. FX8 TaxID=2997335 RepID=UPI00227BDF6F|nr:hypothetical protein [Arthrobacter sp. FX8]WAJ34479.1 hypothetical protein OUO20_06020 [Arthrobacter sp. FX8]
MAFGLPVIIAGQLVPILGPVPTFQWYAAAIVAFAVPAVVIQLVRQRRDTASALTPAAPAA